MLGDFLRGDFYTLDSASFQGLLFPETDAVVSMFRFQCLRLTAILAAEVGGRALQERRKDGAYKLKDNPKKTAKKTING